MGLKEAGWNGNKAGLGATGIEYTVHSIAHAAFNNTTKNGILAPATATTASQVNFRETDIQPSFTLASRMESDNGLVFDTNFFGCKVGSSTFTFEEGRPVSMSVDFIAKDMLHNMDGGADADILKYDAATVAPTMTSVTEQPYFFSKANLKIGGTIFARLRRFSFTIANQLDPRFYINQSDTDDNRQTLHEILEGRRAISFSGSIDMDDTDTAANGGMTSGPDIKLIQYLLNQGFTDAANSGNLSNMSILAGVSLEIELRKFGNNAGASSAKYDTMTFSFPGTEAGTVGTGAYNTDDIGIIFNSARIPVPGPNQVHQTIEIDGIAGSVKCVLKDSSA